MTKTKIITTIGPSSLSNDVLNYFKEHSVEYARLNFSHSNSQWHIDAGDKCRQFGLSLLMDLGGPKIRLGVLTKDIELKNDSMCILEFLDESKSYPHTLTSGEIVLSVVIDISVALEEGRHILIDDGKLQLEVYKIENRKVFCKVITGGICKSRKGVNLPESSLNLSFLTDRDRQMIKDTLKHLKPEVVACSFVKSAKDIEEMRSYLNKIIAENGIDPDYFPKICAKIEQHEVFLSSNLEELVQACDMLMIARGDLALEVTPIHITLPFLQEKIERVCKKFCKPFVVATQILESMIDCPVPTRAEVSDLYRAVVLDQADYIMLSGESAMGGFPKECVDLMDKMIKGSHIFIKEFLE